MHFAGKLAGTEGNQATGGQPQDSTPRLHAAGSAPLLPPGVAEPERQPSLWPDRFRAVGEFVGRRLSRPRVRLCVIGLFLLALGGLAFTSSVWTLPLVIVGAAMVLIAWIGSRLDGRFAVEWGEAGTQLELRAQIKAPKPQRTELARTVPVAAGFEPEPEDADVVDGEAHTVEIDVAELKALIAAAETAEAELARAQQRPAA